MSVSLFCFYVFCTAFFILKNDGECRELGWVLSPWLLKEAYDGVFVVSGLSPSNQFQRVKGS